ncbi:hypothetical protein ASG88_05780 [Nocardioides sp. Soil777]|uniref:hypothetical protein n=1 Tax=Nocardioides sp. Soil777 TaxID=1736409 RepID=UPI0007038A3E|nr:hypothetical protein [Nocardioides sp. Soil777]KRF02868.1 hypothetical protein ASG88_05780 [Nocardioides sp. Soil777]
MVSRHYRNQLQQALSTADADSLTAASLNWSSHASLLDRVSESIRNGGKKVKSEIEGQAGDAMVAKFNSISDKLDLDAADMRKGADAIGVAQAAAIEATKTHNGILLSGPMNQMPTKPTGPSPGTQPTPAQETAMGTYNAQVNTYIANEERYEENARLALQHMDTEYAAATQVMKEIHGEPDPEGPVDVPPPGGTTPGSPTGPISPTTPGTPGTPGTPEPRDPDRPRDPDQPVPPTHIDPPTQTPHPIPNPNPTEHPTYNPPQVPGYQPGTNVAGGTDGGYQYSPGSPGSGSAPSGPAGGGGGGVSGAGMAAGGLAGGAAGAAGMRGSAPAAPLRSAGVKGIGATTRPSGPGSLSRGAGSSGARGAGSPARGTAPGGARGASAGGPRGAAGAKGVAGAGSRSSAKAAGAGTRSSGSSPRSAGSAGAKGAAGRSSGAAGRSGAAANGSGQAKGSGKGRGLFRRGSNGSAAGTRGANKLSDERTEQRDALVYEQDWLGDESAGTGVLD